MELHASGTSRRAGIEELGQNKVDPPSDRLLDHLSLFRPQSLDQSEAGQGAAGRSGGKSVLDGSRTVLRVGTFASMVGGETLVDYLKHSSPLTTPLLRSRTSEK
jgi:hypothetical protein